MIWIWWCIFLTANSTRFNQKISAIFNYTVIISIKGPMHATPHTAVSTTLQISPNISSAIWYNSDGSVTFLLNLRTSSASIYLLVKGIKLNKTNILHAIYINLKVNLYQVVYNIFCVEIVWTIFLLILQFYRLYIRISF